MISQCVTAVTWREKRAGGSSYRNYCYHCASFGASTVGSAQALCLCVCVWYVRCLAPVQQIIIM